LQYFASKFFIPNILQSFVEISIPQLLIPQYFARIKQKKLFAQ